MSVIAELFATLGLETDEGSFEKGQKLIEGVKTALEALAVYEGIKQLHEMVDSTVEAGVAFKHLGEKLGISSDSVQELGYAADVSGASVEDMQTALQHLAHEFDNAKKTGTGPFVDAMNKLKVSFNDPNIKEGKLDDMVARLANAFADAGPNVNKTALAMDLFGRSGTALIPLLNKGADGLEELRQEFQATGAELSGESIESLEHYEETQKRLHYILLGFKNEAVMALVPELQKLADGLQKWIKANRDLIRQRIEQVVHGIIIVLRAAVRVINIAVQVFSVLANIVDKVAEAFGALVGGSAGIEDVLVGAAIAVGAAWALASAPLLLMAALVAALILVVQDLWSGLNGGDSVLANLYHAFVQWLGESGAGRVVLALAHALHEVIDTIEAAEAKLEAIGRKLGISIGEHVENQQLAGTNVNAKTLGFTRGEDYFSGITHLQGPGGLPVERGTKEAEEAAAQFQGYEDARAQAEGLSRINAFVRAGSPTSYAPVFAPHIEVNAPSADPHAISDAVHERVRNFWDDQMNHAANAVGATGGNNLP